MDFDEKYSSQSNGEGIKVDKSIWLDWIIIKHQK